MAAEAIPATDVIIGVDGGATRSRVLALTTACRPAFRADGPGVSLTARTPEENWARLRELLTETLGSAKVPCRVMALVIGIPGAWSPTLRRAIEDAAARAPLTPPMAAPQFRPDCTVALKGGAPQGPAILAIAGTGSSVAARDVHGEVSLYGGWGHLLGDEGSAFAVGRQAIRLCADHEDGLSAPPVFYRELLDRLSAAALREALPALYGPDAKPTIASLASLVDGWAAKGDAQSLALLNGAAVELARRIASARTLAGPSDAAAWPCVMVGGLWDASVLFRSSCERALQGEGARVALQEPLLPPEAGACLLGLEAAGYGYRLDDVRASL